MIQQTLDTFNKFAHYGKQSKIGHISDNPLMSFKFPDMLKSVPNNRDYNLAKGKALIVDRLKLSEEFS